MKKNLFFCVLCLVAVAPYGSTRAAKKRTTPSRKQEIIVSDLQVGLASVRARHSDELATLRDKRSNEVSKTRETHYAQIRELKETMWDAIKAVRTDFRQKIDELKVKQRDEIRQLREEHKQMAHATTSNSALA